MDFITSGAAVENVVSRRSADAVVERQQPAMDVLVEVCASRGPRHKDLAIGKLRHVRA